MFPQWEEKRQVREIWKQLKGSWDQPRDLGSLPPFSSLVPHQETLVLLLQSSQLLVTGGNQELLHPCLLMEGWMNLSKVSDKSEGLEPKTLFQ